MNATIFKSNQPWTTTTLILPRLLIFHYCHPHHLHHSLLQMVIITIIKIIPTCPIAPIIIVLIIIHRLVIVAWVVVVAAPNVRRLHPRSQIRRCRRQRPRRRRPRRMSTIRSRRVIRCLPKPTFLSLTHILTFWWISVVVWAFCWWSRRKSIKGIAWALSAIKSVLWWHPNFEACFAPSCRATKKI